MIENHLSFWSDDDSTVESSSAAAETIVRVTRESLRQKALFGPMTVSMAVGRNDPCVCGSGLKSKFCCPRTNVLVPPPATEPEPALELPSPPPPVIPEVTCSPSRRPGGPVTLACGQARGSIRQRQDIYELVLEAETAKRTVPSVEASTMLPEFMRPSRPRPVTRHVLGPNLAAATARASQILTALECARLGVTVPHLVLLSDSSVEAPTPLGLAGTHAAARHVSEGARRVTSLVGERSSPPRSSPASRATHFDEEGYADQTGTLTNAARVLCDRVEAALNTKQTANESARARRKDREARRLAAGDVFSQDAETFRDRMLRKGVVRAVVKDGTGRVVYEHVLSVETGATWIVQPRTRGDLGVGPWERTITVAWLEGHHRRPQPRGASATRNWSPNPRPKKNNSSVNRRCEARGPNGRCVRNVPPGAGYYSRVYAPHLMCRDCALSIWPELVESSDRVAASETGKKKKPKRGEKPYVLSAHSTGNMSDAEREDYEAFGRAVGEGGGERVRAARLAGDKETLLWMELRKQGELIAGRLRKAGHPRVAEKIERCSRDGWVIECDCKEKYLPERCKERLCPTCQFVEGRERGDRLVAIVRERGCDLEDLSMHTLTIESMADIEQAWGDLQLYFLRYKELLLMFFPQQFGELVDIKDADGNVTKKVRLRGAYRCLETTWHDEHGWHAHVHAMFQHDRVEQDQLADLWFVASGFRGQVHDVRRLYKSDAKALEKGAREVTKGPVHATQKVAAKAAEEAVRDEVARQVGNYMKKIMKCADGAKLWELRASMADHRLADPFGAWEDIDEKLVAKVRKERQDPTKLGGKTCLDCGEVIRVRPYGAYDKSPWGTIRGLAKASKRVVWRVGGESPPPKDKAPPDSTE